MSQGALLIIDDDIELLEALKQYFTNHDFHVYTTPNIKEAFQYISQIKLDCIILDIIMPQQDGFSVCRSIRDTSNIPIIFLSCKNEEEAHIQGFTSGGDDYVDKPFSFKELELRVQARINRRYGDPFKEVLVYGDLTIDNIKRTVKYKNKTGEFSRLEFDILLFLARHPGQVFSYEQIYDNVWKTPLNKSRHTLQARIAEMRHKLQALCPNKQYIKTIRHKGYLFTPDDDDDTKAE